MGVSSRVKVPNCEGSSSSSLRQGHTRRLVWLKEVGGKFPLCTEIIEEENAQGVVEFLISGCLKKHDHFLIRVEKNKLQ
jgi:hypothetical protein